MKLILWIVIAIGITAIYDARRITTKYFSNQDQNTIVSIIKIIGFIMCAICGIILCTIK